MKFQFRVSCRPTVGKDNWLITIYDRETQEVYATQTIHSTNIRSDVDRIVSDFRNILSRELISDVSIDIL